LSNEFYINQAELPEKGRELQVIRNVDWLAQIFRDGVYEGLGDVTISGFVRPVGTNVSLDLKISAPMMFHCSRCGNKNDFMYNTVVQHLFTMGNPNELEIPIDLARNLDTELDITEIKNKKFDAEPTIIENFAGDLSAYPICVKECDSAVLNHSEEEAKCAENVQVDPRLAPLMALRDKMANVSNESESLS
jgi:uncharacterized metal-binding protein YceD (DUF177 family)